MAITQSQDPADDDKVQRQFGKQQSFYMQYGTHDFINNLASHLSDLSNSTPTLPPTLNASSVHAWQRVREQPIMPATPQLQAADARPNLVPTIAFDDTSDASSMSDVSVAAAASSSQLVTELMRIYGRLRDTILGNSLSSCFDYTPNPMNPHEFSPHDLMKTDTLATCLGMSISAVEIAQRGFSSKPGFTLLDNMSPQTLAHLRILSETASSYAAVGGLRAPAGQNRSMREALFCQNAEMEMLFVNHGANFNAGKHSPLLDQDAFTFLACCSVGIASAWDFDFNHIMRLCYLAEIVRVVSKFLNLPTLPAQQDESAEPTGFSTFLYYIAGEWTEEGQTMPLDALQYQTAMRRLVESYALPFLRKSVILMHARYGIDFPFTGIPSADESELDRLTKALHLPSLDEIFESFLNEGCSIQRQLVTGWIKHWVEHNANSNHFASAPQGISVSHPAIFELIGLPRNYDTLTDESIRRKCPTTGKELADPAVCLFCGDFFCSQSVCCAKNGEGGCNQHQHKCGGNIGIFISIRKGMIIFLNQDRGVWMTAPYLDKHGEPDPSLRRHYQLYLNQRRYDALFRSVWLNHQIPTTVARRLEGDINTGGWETL